MRKLARLIAHKNMEKEGIQKPNHKRGYLNGKSFFAAHWREYVR